MTQPTPADQAATIWVVSDVAPQDGTYICTVHIGDDTAWALTRGQALAHAATVITAAAYAAYDAAVLRQIAHLRTGDTSTQEHAALIVRSLRADRPPLDDTTTAPLRLAPVVSARTGQPVVQVYLHGKPFGQWDPADAHQHALQVLEVAVGVDLDAAYLRLLRGHVGLDEQIARKAVAQLADYHDPQPPAGVPEHTGPDLPDDTLLLCSEVAKLFRVDARTVVRWAQAGKLRCIRTLGGHRRYRAGDVRALLAQAGYGATP